MHDAATCRDIHMVVIACPVPSEHTAFSLLLAEGALEMRTCRPSCMPQTMKFACMLGGTEVKHIMRWCIRKAAQSHDWKLHLATLCLQDSRAHISRGDSVCQGS